MAKNVAATTVLLGSDNIAHKRRLDVVTNDELINVRDFNAKGDGTLAGGGTDDTVAIQNAIDYASGTFFAVKGITQQRKIYFPAGIYNVSAATQASYGLGVGHPEIDGDWQCCDNLLTSACLHITARGGGFVGAGKYATVIRAMTPKSIVLHGNGWSNGLIQDMCFKGSGDIGSRCLEWARIASTHPTYPREFRAYMVGSGSYPDGIGPVSNNPVNQAGLTVVNVAFTDAEDCVRLGTGADGLIDGNDQSSETVWISCDFQRAHRAGLAGGNGNCLNINHIGSSFDMCGRVGLGAGPISYPLVQSCVFERCGHASGLPNYDGWQDYDRCSIDMDGSPNNTVGCYSTSASFINYAAFNCCVIACNHIQPGPTAEPYTGLFCQIIGQGTGIVEGNYAPNSLNREPGGDGKTAWRGNKFATGAFTGFTRILENI